MLHKIICDKFKIQPLEFGSGLNCVLGDDVGTNSIGKSTFLMIIDFVFGGDDYIRLDKETITHLGPHEIKFEFEFEDEKFYFIRKTDNPNVVYFCNDKYEIIKEESLDYFLQFLKNKYNLPDEVSIRNSIGRYLRIFPKANINQLKPFNVVNKEAEDKAVLALLKLFDSYNKISELLKDYKKVKAKKDGIKQAQKNSLIPNINKKVYDKNVKIIESIQEEIKTAKETIIEQSINIEALMGIESLNLRKKKSYLITKIGYLRAQIEKTVQSSISHNKSNINTYDEIVEFFPTINIDKIKEIDNFHFEIHKFVTNEIKEYKSQLESQLEYDLTLLEKVNKRLLEISNANQDTQYALDRFASLSSKLEKIKQENYIFEKIKEVESELKDKHELYIKGQQEQLAEVENSINRSLVSLNDYIYNGTKLPPTLELSEKNYKYNTNNDNGTGTTYKNLIILDISILNLTSLPCLAHDSVLLKQIQDSAMEKIAQLYESSHKQIFIAFDKLNSYTEKTKEIFLKHAVLKLSKGNELFGFSWSEK